MSVRFNEELPAEDDSFKSLPKLHSVLLGGIAGRERRFVGEVDQD